MKQVQIGQNVVGRWPSGGGVAGAIRSLVNGKDLQIECVRILHDTLLFFFPHFLTG